MARLFTDGAESGNLYFWDTTAGAVSASTAQKRSGAYSYLLSGNGATATKNAGGSEFYLRFAIRISQCSTERTILNLRYGTNTLAQVRYEPTTARLLAYVGGSLVATANISFALNTWALVEVHYKVANSGGAFDIRLDGANVISYAGDTQPASDTAVDNFYFTANTSFDFYLDDLALNDLSGGVDDAWCNDGYILAAVVPNGNGASSQWVGSDADSTDNYLLVDELPADDDTTYVQSATSGHADSYQMGNFSLNGATVARAWVEATAKGTAAGASVQLRLKSGATTTDSAARALTTSYKRVVSDDFFTDPDTGLAWDETALNAIEAGVVRP